MAEKEATIDCNASKNDEKAHKDFNPGSDNSVLTKAVKTKENAESVSQCVDNSSEYNLKNGKGESLSERNTLNNENTESEPIPGSSNDPVKDESSEDHTVWLSSTKIKSETEDDDSRTPESEEESEEELGEEERLEEDSDEEMEDESDGGAYHLAEVSYGEENEESQKGEGTESDSLLGISHDLEKSTSPRLGTYDDLSSERRLATDFIVRRKNEKVTDLNSGKVRYKNFECLICGYKAPQQSCLLEHIHKHTGEKSHHCLHCDKKFRYKKYLTQHITIYHTDTQAQFSCKLCGLRFYKSSAFERHERTHSGERPFPCQFCDYQAKNRGALKEHLRTHTGEKPYKCEECGYTCAYNTLLKRHYTNHHQVTTYSCQHCSYVTKQMRNLNDHMKTHSGDDLYQCDICGYKSIRKDTLKAHIIHVHSFEIFTCSICNAKFKYAKSLSNHSDKHHADKYPHKCHLCHQRFNKHKGLTLHYRKCHPQHRDTYQQKT